MDKMQEEFEKWASGKGLILRKATSGKQFYYLFEDTDYAWQAWQAARMVPEWISVTDRLPEPDVLVATLSREKRARDGFSRGYDSYSNKPDLRFTMSAKQFASHITYWMPLPAAPEVKK